MKLKGKQKFFIQEHLLREKIFHGGIGNKQIEEILLKSGYEAIHFPFQFSFSWKAKMHRFLYLVRLLFALPGGGCIVFQWPLYSRIHVLLINLLKRIRPTVQLICFVTDINGLKNNDQLLLKKELRLFTRLRFFIVHNAAMQEWLLQYHPSAEVALLEFFDFLATPNSVRRKKELAVAFAGYLDKSSFVKDLKKIPEVDFYLYGITESYSFTDATNVYYAGVYEPEKLPMVIKGSFGLVWDGESITGLEGVFGDYNRYISPHKLSLYMLAGIPVIAHESAGAASLIHQHRIGFTVNSLQDLKEAIASISDEQYWEMQCNCFRFAAFISKGEYLLKALSQLRTRHSSSR